MLRARVGGAYVRLQQRTMHVSSPVSKGGGGAGSSGGGGGGWSSGSGGGWSSSSSSSSWGNSHSTSIPWISSLRSQHHHHHHHNAHSIVRSSSAKRSASNYLGPKIYEQEHRRESALFWVALAVLPMSYMIYDTFKTGQVSNTSM